MAETPHPANLTFHGHDGSVPLMPSNRPKAMTAMEGTYPQYSTVTTGAQPNIQGAPQTNLSTCPPTDGRFRPNREIHPKTQQISNVHRSPAERCTHLQRN